MLHRINHCFWTAVQRRSVPINSTSMQQTHCDTFIVCPPASDRLRPRVPTRRSRGIRRSVLPPAAGRQPLQLDALGDPTRR